MTLTTLAYKSPGSVGGINKAINHHQCVYKHSDNYSITRSLTHHTAPQLMMRTVKVNRPISAWHNVALFIVYCTLLYCSRRISAILYLPYLPICERILLVRQLVTLFWLSADSPTDLADKDRTGDLTDVRLFLTWGREERLINRGFLGAQLTWACEGYSKLMYAIEAQSYTYSTTLIRFAWFNFICVLIKRVI